MIAFVRGELVSKRPTDVLVDVGGIGYRILIPTSTYERLPAQGKEVRLLTHHHVREDAESLFGFMSEAERSIFETMLGVNGVGPKLALAALSAMSPADLRSHVLAGEAGFLTSIPGVGRKTAERMIVELRDRFAATEYDVQIAGDDELASQDGARARSDAIAALEQLGFSRAAADKSLRAVFKNHPSAASADELVRLALRERA